MRTVPHERHPHWRTFAAHDIFGVLTYGGREFAWVRDDRSTPLVGSWVEVSGNSPGAAFFRAFYGPHRYVERFDLEPPVAGSPGLREAVRDVSSAPEDRYTVLSGPSMSHRVWQDYGTDGTRRWPRWWCSCGAHGQGWPANHGGSR